MKQHLATWIFLLSSPLLWAQPFTEIIKKVAPDRASADHFGYSVAISGDRAIVGTYQKTFDDGDTLMSNAGQVYFFHKDQGSVNGWGWVATLTAPDVGDGDRFGYSVDLHGDYAIVGAPREDEDASFANTLISDGAAYIYKYDAVQKQWTLLHKVVANDRASGDNFGHSVGITDEYAVVGALDEDHDANGAQFISSAGSAYIFKQDKGGVDAWGLLKKITASNRLNSTRFGERVAIDGNFIVVSSTEITTDANEQNPLTAAGAAFIFRKDEGGTDNWGQTAKIVPNDRAADDQFGEDCAIALPYLIVGAGREDYDQSGANALSNAGSAYIFEVDETNGACTQLQKIVAADRASNANFGMRVDIDGSLAVVGAAFNRWDANGANPLTSSGAVYVFHAAEGGKNNWGQIQKIVHSDRDAGDLLGTDVGISGHFVLAGAEDQATDESNLNPLAGAGAVYFFEQTGTLPVEWTSFTAENAHSNTALLRWQTATERNNHGFTIQRSSDGSTWQDIGIVSGQGTTTLTTDYQYHDHSPRTGLNYYRLQQHDWDGHVAYSAMRSVSITAPNNAITFYPNPVRDYLVLQNTQGVVTIHNAAGQAIYQAIHTTPFTTIDTRKWRSSWYRLSVQREDGSISHFKILK